MPESILSVPAWKIFSAKLSRALQSAVTSSSLSSDNIYGQHRAEGNQLCSAYQLLDHDVGNFMISRVVNISCFMSWILSCIVNSNGKGISLFAPLSPLIPTEWIPEKLPGEPWVSYSELILHIWCSSRTPYVGLSTTRKAGPSKPSR